MYNVEIKNIFSRNASKTSKLCEGDVVVEVGGEGVGGCTLNDVIELISQLPSQVTIKTVAAGQWRLYGRRMCVKVVRQEDVCGGCMEEVSICVYVCVELEKKPLEEKMYFRPKDHKDQLHKPNETLHHLLTSKFFHSQLHRPPASESQCLPE